MLNPLGFLLWAILRIWKSDCWMVDISQRGPMFNNMLNKSILKHEFVISDSSSWCFFTNIKITGLVLYMTYCCFCIWLTVVFSFNIPIFLFTCKISDVARVPRITILYQSLGSVFCFLNSNLFSSCPFLFIGFFSYSESWMRLNSETLDKFRCLPNFSVINTN